MDNVKIMSVELGDVNKQVQELDGSYNSLAKHLRELRKEWKATNDEGQRNELAKQMVEINNQLKCYNSFFSFYMFYAPLNLFSVYHTDLLSQNLFLYSLYLLYDLVLYF